MAHARCFPGQFGAVRRSPGSSCGTLHVICAVSARRTRSMATREGGAVSRRSGSPRGVAAAFGGIVGGRASAAVVRHGAPCLRAPCGRCRFSPGSVGRHARSRGPCRCQPRCASEPRTWCVGMPCLPQSPTWLACSGLAHPPRHAVLGSTRVNPRRAATYVCCSSPT